MTAFFSGKFPNLFIVAHAFTRIQTIHRVNTVTENNKMTNTRMNKKQLTATEHEECRKTTKR